MVSDFNAPKPNRGKHGRIDTPLSPDIDVPAPQPSFSVSDAQRSSNSGADDSTSDWRPSLDGLPRNDRPAPQFKDGSQADWSAAESSVPASWSPSTQGGGEPPATAVGADSASGPHMPGPNVTRVRRKHHRRRKAPIVITVLVVLLVLVGVGGALLFASAQSLRSDASSAMKQLSAVQTAIGKSDYNAAASSAQQVKSTADSMNSEISSPLWSAASVIPVLGSDVSGVKTMVSVLQDASANALVPLTSNLQANPPASLVSADGAINVESVQILLNSVETVAPVMQRCSDKLNTVPTMNISQLQPVVDSAKEKVDGINGGFQQAAAFAPIANAVLGADDERTYLIAAQNSSEIRSSGGFPGSMGTMTITDGKMELSDFSPVYDVFYTWTPDPLTASPVETQLFDEFVNVSRDAGFNPNFPRVAEIWAAAYEERNGETVDGVISITPSMVQRILSVTGGITLSDGTKLDGTNATKVLQHDLYWKYLSQDARSYQNARLCDELFAEAATLSFDKLLSNMSSETMMKFSSALVEGIDDRTLMMWMSDPTEQTTIMQTGCSGAIADDSADSSLGVYFSLWIGSKMGWYLDMDTTVSDGVKNADGTTTYQVRTVYSNTATANDIAGAGEYITGTYEGYAPGDMSPYLYLYAPAGGSISDLQTSDGSVFSTANIDGRQVTYQKKGKLLPGTDLTCTYTVTTAAGAGPLTVSTTPTLTQYR